ncbi:MAG: hypothetical protein R8G66_02205 [Cytophagales bacterium]|nr:hypothetical protein [Cytophagales bacterium]
MKANFSKILIEFISIVFAVLLALVLNQWRENEATKKKVFRVVENIHQEIIRNDSLVRWSLNYRLNLLKEIEEGDHRIASIPVASLEIDTEDDQALAQEIKTALLFNSHSYKERVEVRRSDDQRILILGESVFEIESRNDTIFVLGVGSIHLRSADISLNSFQIAQVTGVLVELDLELVEELSRLNTLIENYQATSGDAINYIYRGNQLAVISSMQDMAYFEGKIVEGNERVLNLLVSKSD